MGQDNGGSGGGGASYQVITPRNRRAANSSLPTTGVGNSKVFSRSGFVLGEGEQIKFWKTWKIFSDAAWTFLKLM